MAATDGSHCSRGITGAESSVLTSARHGGIRVDEALGAVINTVTPLIKEFFDHYARSRSVQDIDLIAIPIPDSFMVAGPNGAEVAQKSAVVAAFPQGQAALNRWGTSRRRSCPWTKHE